MTMTQTTTSVGDDVASPLDALLVEAALSPIRRFAPDLSTARLLASLATRRTVPVRRLGNLTRGPRADRAGNVDDHALPS